MKSLSATIVFLALIAGCAQRSDSNSGSANNISPNPALVSPLSTIALPHGGAARHEGSWDRSGGNADMRRVEPGKTLTLLDYQGAGVIHRFWVTIAPRAEMHIHRQAILRMYWDDETEPSVECPIGDFFGVGFGQQKDYISLPLNETSGGYNCYWPMPFHKHARWTLENRSEKPIDAFYYNIDYTAFDSIPADMKHFHAQWRRENPTDPMHNYTILEAEGDGHFVGTALFMQAIKPRGISFLEGDEVIYIDQADSFIADMKASDRKGTEPANQRSGKPTPQIIGTGTEDYFSSGWYFDRGLYSAPYHGVTIKDELNARVSAYRWHIEDAMPFHKSIRVSIEHGTNNDHSADYSSVAYFYQSEPHKAFPPLPKDAKDLLPSEPPAAKHFANVIEAEALRDSAKITGGNLNIQSMDSFHGEWSGDHQLFWTETKEGDELTLQIPAKEDGTYELSAYVTTAKDYGIIQPLFNGQPLGGKVDLYTTSVDSHPAKLLGKVTLKKGNNPVSFKIVGKNSASKNYLVGLDAFSLKAVKQ